MKRVRIFRIMAVVMLLSVWLVGLSVTPVMAGPEINISPDWRGGDYGYHFRRKLGFL